VFGIDNTTLETLQKIAELKFENSQQFQDSFKNEIENGINYNTALKRAICKSFDNDEIILEVLNKPNNILAIEYLVAIKKLGAKIIPVAIKRVDNGFESRNSAGKFLSATAIREKFYNGEDIKNFIPTYAEINEIFNKYHYDIFEKLVIHKLRNSTPAELEKYYDYSEGIEYRIKEMTDKFGTLDEIISNISTPRYRKKRVAKLALYPILNITKSCIKNATKTKPVARLLLIKKEKKYILSNIRKTKINLIISNNDYKLLNKNQKNIIDIDLNASNLYNLIFSKENNKDKKIGVIFK